MNGDVKVSEGERAVTARITTAAVDRDGDVLLPQGANTKDFEANPVVYLAHDYFTLPIGKVTSLKRTDSDIQAKVVFASRPNDFPAGKEWMPDTLLSLYQQGVLRGWSVGMIPNEARPANKRDKTLYGDEVRRVFTKWTLMELSVAPIPANQEALTLAVSKGLCTKHAAEQLFGIDTSQIECVKVKNLRIEIEPDPTLKAIERSIARRGRLYLNGVHV
jgi:phage head maturation protease